MKEYPLKEIGNELLFNGFVNISNRLESLLTLNPEKRYLKLLNENPKLLNKIPLKLIASYLNNRCCSEPNTKKNISTKK